MKKNMEVYLLDLYAQILKELNTNQSTISINELKYLIYKHINSSPNKALWLPHTIQDLYDPTHPFNSLLTTCKSLLTQYKYSTDKNLIRLIGFNLMLEGINNVYQISWYPYPLLNPNIFEEIELRHSLRFNIPL